MKQRVRDYRNYDGKQQRVPAIGARTRDNATKRLVKRTADRNDKLHKPGGAASREQRQKKSHSEQRVDYPENVIDDLRYARERSRTFNFALSVNDLVNCF